MSYISKKQKILLGEYNVLCSSLKATITWRSTQINIQYLKPASRSWIFAQSWDFADDVGENAHSEWKMDKTDL